MKRMKKGLIFGLSLITAILAGVLLMVWAFPRVVSAMPNRLKLYLPEEVLQAASTPLPTALPAPEFVAQPAISLPTLMPPTPTLPPTFTAVAPPPANAASAANTAVPTPTLHPTQPPTATAVPAQAFISGLEVMPQKFNNCGPANLAINLAHYGRDIDQLDIAAEIRPVYEDRNVSPEELVDYVNNHTTLKANVFSGGDLNLLKRLLANGYPVIIEKGYVPNDWQGWMGHYLTLIGYDDSQQQFTALDTFLGPWDSSGLTETYDVIDDHWQHFNYTFLVVYPPENEQELHTVLGPEFATNRLMWQRAAEIAQIETRKNPQNSYAWFNLGSSLTQLGQESGDAAYFENAANAFDQARTLGLPWRMLWYQFHPYEAYLAVNRTEDVLILANATLSSGGGQEEGYYYRGQAYLAQGNPEQARLDFSKALEANPTMGQAQNALNQLNP